MPSLMRDYEAMEGMTFGIQLKRSSQLEPTDKCLIISARARQLGQFVAGAPMPPEVLTAAFLDVIPGSAMPNVIRRDAGDSLVGVLVPINMSNQIKENDDG